jgi:prepilin-type N-terminal cleavage/methylation domain-containing protein
MMLCDKTPFVSPTRAALTLVESLVALSILAVVSTAVTVMLHAGAQVSTAMGAAISNQWEVQTALERIVAQSRVCTILNVPSGTAGGTSFSLTTQLDPANGNASYNVTYTLAPESDGTKSLQETDPRYGTSTLVHNVQSFNVRTKNASPLPQVVIIDLTAGTSPPVSRTIRITPRNQ